MSLCPGARRALEFPVLEEVAPMIVEEVVPEVASPDIVVIQNEDVMSELTPQQGFSEEQLHLIFEFVGMLQTNFIARRSSVISWICSSTLSQASL
jgi:hypothetical protein